MPDLQARGPDFRLRIPQPLIAPLGVPVNRDIVREVWDTYVTKDEAYTQSAEERALMAILRAVYEGLPPTEKEPQ